MNNYGFCKFRIPSQGKRVIWEVTNECNYGCKYCIFASTGRKPVGELDTNQIFKLLKELKENDFTHIKYTGGEPFLREDMISILQETQRLGFTFDISTNASRITEEIATQLSQLSIEMVHVSLDGHTREIHEAVRGKKSFEPTLNGLKKLSNKVRVGCVIHQHNENHLVEMIKFGEELNINELIFSLMEPVGRLRGKDNNLSRRPINELIKEIESYKANIKVSHNLVSVAPIQVSSSQCCPGGDKFLFINSIGNISPCTWVTEKSPEYGLYNIKKQSLKEVLSQMNGFKSIVQLMPSICPMEKVKEFKEKEALQLKFKPIYTFSTENLEYLSHINLKNKEVVTIGGSFDQAIVSYMLGAKKVINIDNNINAKYFSELKYYGLKHLNYTEFKDFFLRGEKSFDKKLWLHLRDYLSPEAQSFFDMHYSLVIRESALFNNKYDTHEIKIFNSYYLRDQSKFNSAKENLKDWIWLNQSIESDAFKTDVLLLSNLSDYAHSMFQDVLDFKEKIIKPWYSHMQKGGTIVTSYLYDGANKQRSIINEVGFREQLYTDLGIYREINVPTALIGQQTIDSIGVLTNE